MAARPPRFLFICAKRQPATPIRKLRLVPSSGLTSNNAKHSPAISQFGCTLWIKVKNRKHPALSRVMDQFEWAARPAPNVRREK